MHLEHHPFSPVAATLKKARGLVDGETGVVRMLYEAPLQPDSPKIFGCGSDYHEYVPPGRSAARAIGGSTSLSRDQAMAGAIGEAAERYSAGFVPYDEIRHAKYSTVAHEAISPRALTLYDEDQYRTPKFGYAAFDPEAELGWVEAHSLTFEATKLVPAFAVYQPYLSTRDEPVLFQQISTGLACGNTREEAILSAVCEVVERDAAMSMWLEKRSLPQVTVRPGQESLASATLASFGRLGKNVTILDATTDLGIPVYVVVWNGRIGKERGCIFSSCANISADRAIAGALTELSQCLLWATSLIDRKTPIPDPLVSEISSIEEHVLWPMGSNARSTLDFVFSSDQRTTPEVHKPIVSVDVLDLIRDALERIKAQGLEVLIVDLTAPDLRSIGLHVVRAIIPGGQPLFFGSGMQRISDRVRRRFDPGNGHDRINLHPHPFP